MLAPRERAELARCLSDGLCFSASLWHCSNPSVGVGGLGPVWGQDLSHWDLSVLWWGPPPRAKTPGTNRRTREEVSSWKMASGDPASDSDKEFPLSSFLITSGFHLHLLSPARVRAHTHTHTHTQTLYYLSIDQLLLPRPMQFKVENLQPQNTKTQIIVFLFFFLSPFLFSSFCLSLSLSSFFLFASLCPFFSVKCGNCCLVDNSYPTALQSYAHQVSLSMRFSGQEYWSGLPCPPPRDLPNPGIEPGSPTLQADSLSSEPPVNPKNTGVGSLSLLQGIFLTQKSNQGLLNCRWILY